MASTIVPAFGSRLFTVAAASILSTYSAGAYTVESIGGYAANPGPNTLTFSGTGANSTAAYGAATQVLVTAGRRRCPTTSASPRPSMNAATSRPRRAR
jgi:hypothetical protein